MNDDREKCPFCGLLTEMPCDSPPPMMCDKLNEALLRELLRRRAEMIEVRLTESEIEHAMRADTWAPDVPTEMRWYATARRLLAAKGIRLKQGLFRLTEADIVPPYHVFSDHGPERAWVVCQWDAVRPTSSATRPAEPPAPA